MYELLPQTVHNSLHSPPVLTFPLRTRMKSSTNHDIAATMHALTLFSTQPTSGTTGSSKAQLAARRRCRWLFLHHDATIHRRQQGIVCRPRGGVGSFDRFRLLSRFAPHHWQVHAMVLQVKRTTSPRFPENEAIEPAIRPSSSHTSSIPPHRTALRILRCSQEVKGRAVWGQRLALGDERTVAPVTSSVYIYFACARNARPFFPSESGIGVKLS